MKQVVPHRLAEICISRLAMLSSTSVFFWGLVMAGIRQMANLPLCNVGIGTTKEIKITDSFSIPVTGQVIFNPEKEQLYVVVGFSF